MGKNIGKSIKKDHDQINVFKILHTNYFHVLGCKVVPLVALLQDRIHLVGFKVLLI